MLQTNGKIPKQTMMTGSGNPKFLFFEKERKK